LKKKNKKLSIKKQIDVNFFDSSIKLIRIEIIEGWREFKVLPNGDVLIKRTKLFWDWVKKKNTGGKR